MWQTNTDWHLLCKADGSCTHHLLTRDGNGSLQQYEERKTFGGWQLSREDAVGMGVIYALNQSTLEKAFEKCCFRCLLSSCASHEPPRKSTCIKAKLLAVETLVARFKHAFFSNKLSNRLVQVLCPNLRPWRCKKMQKTSRSHGPR